MGRVPGPTRTGALPVTATIELADPALHFPGDPPETVTLLTNGRRTLLLPWGTIVRADGLSDQPFAPSDLVVRRGNTTFTPVAGPPGPTEVQLDPIAGTLDFASALPNTGTVQLEAFVGTWDETVERFRSQLAVDVYADSVSGVDDLSRAVDAALAPARVPRRPGCGPSSRSASVRSTSWPRSRRAPGIGGSPTTSTSSTSRRSSAPAAGPSPASASTAGSRPTASLSAERSHDHRHHHRREPAMSEAIAEMVIPGTYIEVRSEGLISVGSIATGNIGIVGTAAKGPVNTVVPLGSFPEVLDIFGPADSFTTPVEAATPLTLTRALAAGVRGRRRQRLRRAHRQRRPDRRGCRRAGDRAEQHRLHPHREERGLGRQRHPRHDRRPGHRRAPAVPARRDLRLGRARCSKATT